MYSVVMMMALTTSVDTVDRHGCCGCSGGHHRHHGCCSYNYCGCGCYQNYCGCGCYQQQSCGCGCYQQSYCGCGCYQQQSCGCCSYGGYGAGGPAAGPARAPQGAPAPAPAPAAPTGPKSSIEAPAKIIVSLPADAKLSIDGAVTTATSTERVFLSPELPAGREFAYTLTAEFSHEGKNVTVSKTVNVRAGAESRVSINAADLAGVASR